MFLCPSPAIDNEHHDLVFQSVATRHRECRLYSACRRCGIAVTKDKMKKQTKPQNEGHKAHFAIVAKAKVTVDGKTQEFDWDFDVNFTVEMIDYAIKMVAGNIAQVADKIARDGIKVAA
jgi:hypothetical protein